MTQPTQQNLEIMRGDTERWSLIFDEPAVVAEFDEIWITIRASTPTTQPDDSDATIQLTLGNGISPATEPDTIDVEISAVQSSALDRSLYVYDVQVRTLDSKIFTTQYGTIRVVGDVTRST